ncbi:MAG: hypothetical protein COU32_03680 [Candidatus Magasanikbacteria bacterium CG10_big_fil_rev_8_21_14_0_10_42_10]|uniref:Uncharacterized protein n=2 Tax=Candidatus Magasanikiibacteriota TaxID=1752731 RepID=A0A2H0TVD0_9BACT|nr:MAG: hypothetical protein COU32_03680 [Candidatus Magasanikbacteria bacterium CG10_big_fil_rev_8_21_14_0_10_42_10]PIZ94226.1 MAG: hypothetical protein COX82_01090 [Candidatus Magasanikbacteria bacterium CG_4_10_14_0_2_um_filter_41_10]
MLTKRGNFESIVAFQQATAMANQHRLLPLYHRARHAEKEEGRWHGLEIGLRPLLDDGGMPRHSGNTDTVR